MSTSDEIQVEMHKAGREIDRRAQAYVKSGEVKSYSEGFLKVMKESPELVKVYSQAPAVRPAAGDSRRVNLSDAQREQVSMAYYELQMATEAAVAQGRAEHVSMWKTRVYDEMKRRDPAVCEAYHSGGEIPPRTFSELRGRVFKA